MPKTERIGRTNRDIFDVWFFLKNNWDFNEEIIIKKSGMPVAAFLRKAIDVLDTMNDANILSGMGELLNAKQKAWAKVNLKKDTLFLLRLALDNEIKK